MATNSVRSAALYTAVSSRRAIVNKRTSSLQNGCAFQVRISLTLVIVGVAVCATRSFVRPD
eukprot:6206431-Pleurochrysis_carterae.AAC.4